MNRFIVILITSCTIVSAQVPPATAGVDGPQRVYRFWTAFIHPSCGYVLPVPPGVHAVGVPEAEVEPLFVSADRSFRMTAWGGISPQSPASVMEAQWQSARAGKNRTLNYQRKGSTWFVVSGTDSSGIEYYEKFVMRGSQVAGFSITFPRSRMAQYATWVERIEDGFKIASSPDVRMASAARLASGRASDGPMAKVDRPSTLTDERPERRTTPAVETEEDKPDKPDPGKTPEPEVSSTADDLPTAEPVPGRPGFVYSPFARDHKLVDVKEIASGTKVKCPYTMKIFRVP